MTEEQYNFECDCEWQALAELEKEQAWQTVYEQLQEIQEKIADKTLSFWCIYEFWWDKFPICIHSIKALKNNVWTYKVIWHPISLSRVLSALGHWYWYDFSNQMIMFMKDSFIDGIYWYLLKEDKSDAMLDDQSDETIEALHKLLVRK